MIINKVVKNSADKYAEAFGGEKTEWFGNFALDRTGNKWNVYSHDFEGVCKVLNNKPKDCDFEELVRHFAQVTVADCDDVVKLYDNNDSTEELIEGFIDWQLGEYEYDEREIIVEPDVEEMDITPVWLEIADWLRGKTWDEILDALDDSVYSISANDKRITFDNDSLEFTVQKRDESIYLLNHVTAYDGDKVYTDYIIDDVVDYPLYEPKKKVDPDEFVITEMQGMALDILRGALKMCKSCGVALFYTPELGVHAYNANAASLVTEGDADYKFVKSECCTTGVDLEYFGDVIDCWFGDDYGLNKKAA